ncbi:MAG: thiamine pyrophosphate-dependent enzyme, partial [Oscillospiraceae bacterium]
DSSAIGGNHLIHACRRNIDLTLVIINNNIYGMTSGQYSPLTPTGALATTAPYGNIDRPFDIVKLTSGAGATYVARASVYHVAQLKNYIQAGIQHKGFAVIEAVSTCPTYFGRRNKRGDAAQMMVWLKDNCEMKKPGVDTYEKPYVIGEFVNIEAPEYASSYEQVIAKAGGNK